MNRLQSLTVLLVSDLERSKAFYQDVLGCEVNDWWAIRNDSLKLGFKLLQATEHQVIYPNSQNNEVLWDTYAYVDDFAALDQIYDEWKQKGAKIIQEPEVTEFDWGAWKEFAIADPDGYVLALGTANKE